MTNSNNVQNVKFLRNGALIGSREAARTALENNKTLGLDGSAILARYSGGTVEDGSFFIKTLVGFVYADNANTAVTIFDIDDAGTDAKEYVDSLVGSGITSANTATAQLEALSGTSSDASGVTSVWGAKAYTDDKIDGLDVAAITAPAGAFIKSVSQSDGKVSATTEYMPTVSAISAEGKAITAVSQSNGTISASAGNIDSQYVNVSYSAITAENVKEALAEIADKINAMDKSASAFDGQVVTTVSENDGVVSETKANVKDLQLGGYSKSSSTGAIASTDTINEALSKLENKAAAITVTPKDKSIVVETTGATTEVGVNIRSGERVLKLDTDATSGGVYTALDLVKITEGLPAEIKERYQFKATDGSVIGANIDIPKDSHIVSINYITGGTHAQNLEYVYVDVSGNTQTTYVDMSALVLEAEFESGVTVDAGSHIVHGVVDPTSETFLTVGSNGFKLDGVQNTIDSAINALDATGGTQTIASDKHVAVEVIEADGKITTVTVVEDDIASAQGLAEEIAARKAVDGQSGQTYAANTNANYISGATSLNDADVKLDAALKSLSNETVNQVKVNGVALTKENNAVNAQISAAAGTGAETAAIAVNTDNSTGAVTISLLGLDCGTY